MSLNNVPQIVFLNPFKNLKSSYGLIHSALNSAQSLVNFLMIYFWHVKVGIHEELNHDQVHICGLTNFY